MVLGIRQKQVDFNFHFKYMVDIFDLLFIVKHCWNNFFKIKTPEFMYHLKVVAFFLWWSQNITRHLEHWRVMFFSFCHTRLFLPSTWCIYFQPYFLCSISCTLIATFVTFSLIFKLQSICFLKAHIYYWISSTDSRSPKDDIFLEIHIVLAWFLRQWFCN